ncbi:MAG: S-layer homology domain-containing protein [Ruminococcaceae bacterium]|nr:S-layer homology domain-containing protein [Oscillospiraceae bacterium]
MKKSIISIALLIAILFPSVVFAEQNKIYSDNEVREISSKLEKFGIFSVFDDEQFYGENNPVVRSEAARAIASLIGMDGMEMTDAVSNIYLDVPPYHNNVGEISAMVSMGIMTGMGNGLFNPDGEMTVEQFLKCIVVALGYKWKAEIYGGYPTGYVKVATELELEKDITSNYNDILTRGVLIHILYNALDKPLCEITSVSQDNMDYIIDKEVTVLTKYHDIYRDKAIVYSDRTKSIVPDYKTSAEKVLIGDINITVGNCVEVYSCLGKEVEFYYRKNDRTESCELILVEETRKNTVIYVNARNILSVTAEKVEYEDETGKTQDLRFASDVVLVYNEEVCTNNIVSKLRNAEGVLTFIENNDEGDIDIVIAENCTYDKLSSVSVDTEKIYGENSVYWLSEYDNVTISMAPLGEVVDLSALQAGDVIACIRSENGKSIHIKVHRSGINVDISRVSENSAVLADDTEVYLSSTLSTKQREMIQPGARLALILDHGNEVVWVEEASSSLKVGYLISAYEDVVFAGEKEFAGVRLLTSDSIVKILKIKEGITKFNVNGSFVKLNSVVSLLGDIKKNLNVGGDGLVSQVVAYATDENGNLTEIHTALPSEDSELYIKYNYLDNGTVTIRDYGYGAGVYGVTRTPTLYTYALTNTYPIFQVPEENQENLDDKYFTKITYSNSRMPHGQGHMLDAYVADKRDVVPTAMVYYKTVSYSAPTNSTFFLIDEVVRTLDDDGALCWQISGAYEKEIMQIQIESGIDITSLKTSETSNEMPGLTQGDVVWFRTDVAGTIIVIEKVFDYESEQVKTSLVEAELTAATAVRYMYVYNAPKDSLFVEGFTQDLANGVPGDDKLTLFSYVPSTSGTSALYSYDATSEKVSVGKNVDAVVDYLTDTENYSRILVKWENAYQAESIIYNR